MDKKLVSHIKNVLLAFLSFCILMFLFAPAVQLKAEFSAYYGYQPKIEAVSLTGFQLMEYILDAEALSFLSDSTSLTSFGDVYPMLMGMFYIAIFILALAILVCSIKNLIAKSKSALGASISAAVFSTFMLQMLTTHYFNLIEGLLNSQKVARFTLNSVGTVGVLCFSVTLWIVNVIGQWIEGRFGNEKKESRLFGDREKIDDDPADDPFRYDEKPIKEGDINSASDNVINNINLKTSYQSIERLLGLPHGFREPTRGIWWSNASDINRYYADCLAQRPNKMTEIKFDENGKCSEIYFNASEVPFADKMLTVARILNKKARYTAEDLETLGASGAEMRFTDGSFILLSEITPELPCIGGATEVFWTCCGKSFSDRIFVIEK